MASQMQQAQLSDSKTLALNYYYYNNVVLKTAKKENLVGLASENFMISWASYKS